MTTPLTIRTSQHPDGSTVLTAAAGEIDQSNADSLASALADLSAQPEQGGSLVDLTAVEIPRQRRVGGLVPARRAHPHTRNAPARSGTDHLRSGPAHSDIRDLVRAAEGGDHVPGGSAVAVADPPGIGFS